jgi:hypothetical protein
MGALSAVRLARSTRSRRRSVRLRVMEYSQPAQTALRDSREPGWYPDPGNPEGLSHWDGARWSESLFDEVESIAATRTQDPSVLFDDATALASPTPAVTIEDVQDRRPAAPPPTPAPPTPARPTAGWQLPRKTRTAGAGLVAASVIILAVAGVPRRRIRRSNLALPGS